MSLLCSFIALLAVAAILKGIEFLTGTEIHQVVYLVSGITVGVLTRAYTP